MSKRQEIRDRRRQEEGRKRLVAIAMVAVGVLVIFALIMASVLKSSDPGNIISITPASHTVPVNKTSMGNPNAKVKMDVWEDFQCTGCLAYTQDLEPQIIQAYVETGKILYTFRFYPFIDRGQGESHDAANAAMCAAAQGRFWDYHDITFANWIGENAGSYTEGRLVAFAENIGLDMPAFNQCFKNKTYSAQIQQDVAAGSKLGVPPTPGIFVNGQMVLSSAGVDYIPSFEDIARAIDALLGSQ
jgi:protein-disulfide isomerase